MKAAILDAKRAVMKVVNSVDRKVVNSVAERAVRMVANLVVGKVEMTAVS